MNQFEPEQATILIVDDNPENLKILQQLLTIQGYRIRPAISGEFALHVARSTPPDLILLDIMMTGIDGFEVCRQLKADERLRDIPVIFLSALGDTADKVRAFALGGVDYVTKPFQVEEVLARVRTHLSLRQAQQQLHAQNARLQAEILERQQAQAALQESESRYRFLVDHSSDLITKIDRKNRMVFVTEASMEFAGYAPEEMLNTPCFDYIHPDDHARIDRVLRDVLDIGIEAVTEFRARHKNGQYFWIESTAKRVFNAAGEPEAIAIHRNISERKQAEIALREREELFRGMFEHHSAIMYLIDPQTGRIMMANHAAVQFYGYAQAELHGMNIAQINQLPMEDIFHAMQDARDHRQNVFEFRHRLAGGAMRDVEVHTTPINVAEQNLLFSIVHDITARKQMEAKLRESEEYHRNLLNILPDGLTIIDLDGRFTFISPQSYAMYGVPPECSFIGASAFDWFEPDESPRLVERMKQIMAKQNGIPGEYRAHAYDGRPLWVELSSAPLTNAHGEVTGIMTITRNISDRKHTEEALQQAKEAAEAANLAKSAFLANMSHELRTPLNGILGYAQLLKRDDSVKPRHREFASIIERSGQHLLAMINDILDLAKVEAGRLEIRPTKMRLLSLIEDVEGMISIKANNKGLRFQTIKEAHLPEFVEGDEHRLRQILLNLLGNAVKFTDRGGVTLRVGAASGARPKNGQSQESAPVAAIFFEIADTGIGIAPEDLAKLFTPFQQVGEAARKAQGTGLGLAISRNLAALMGGTLTVSSTFGGGSSFRFEVSLPLIAASGCQSSECREIAGVCGATPTILVVDDVPENRQVLAELLTSWGCHVIDADNGQQALQQAIAAPPTAIIADLRMPGMDGVELIQRLRQTPECGNIPIIASSASVYQEYQQQSLAAGAQAFLPKPIDANALSELLSALGVAEWRYKQTSPPAVSADRIEELPPLSTLRILSDLTNLGDILALREHLATLTNADSEPTPFVAEIQELARHFRIDRIRQMLDARIHEAMSSMPETEAALAWPHDFPPEWRERLRMACIIADIEDIKNVIHDIRTIAPIFADQLEGLTNHFEYDQILRILECKQT